MKEIIGHVFSISKDKMSFAKGGRHSVKAINKFKMALLLTLE